MTITSKSIGSGDAWNVPDFSSVSYFQSIDRPGQWVGRDFHELLVRLTHYAITEYMGTVNIPSRNLTTPCPDSPAFSQKPTSPMYFI
jgi:hypothetical protein